MQKRLSTFNSSSLPLGVCFSVALGVVVFVLIQCVSWSHTYSDDKVQSTVLPQLREGRHYDIVTMGSSHNGEMKFHGNFKRVTDVIQKDIIVLGRQNAGIVPMSLLLETFFHYGNTVDTILFFIDPFMFSRHKDNLGSVGVAEEPLDWFFTKRLIELGFDRRTILSHFAYNVRLDHLYSRVSEGDMYSIHSQTVFDADRWARRAELYRIQDDAFLVEKVRLLNSLIEHHSDKHWILVMPPIVIGDDLIGDELALFKSVIETEITSESVSFYDYSGLIPEYRYFMDMDHLNAEGWAHFAKVGLKPILK